MERRVGGSRKKKASPSYSILPAAAFFARTQEKKKHGLAWRPGMDDDLERAVLYSFDVTGAVGPELKVRVGASAGAWCWGAGEERPFL